MHIVAGGYDGSVVGLQLAPASGKPPLVSRTRFNYAPHTGCVKTLASSAHTLVSTGTDERVLVYDLKRRAEYGTLMQHEDTVTCADFWGGHLLTGSDDKTVIIWRTKDWVALHTLRGHKGKLTALAVHPSGKLSLAADSRGILYVWDLTAAKCVLRHRTPPSSVVRWSPDGESYAAVQGKEVVLSTVGAETISTVSSPSAVSDAAFLDDHTLVMGGDGKAVGVWDCRTAAASVVHTAGTLGSRVKSVKVFELGGARYVAAAAAEGTIAVYDTRALSSSSAAAAGGGGGGGGAAASQGGGCTPVWSVESRTRLTCMEVVKEFEGEHEEEAGEQ
jgi:protein MAK11